MNHQQNQTPRAWQFSDSFKQQLLGSEIAVFDVSIFLMKTSAVTAGKMQHIKRAISRNTF